MNEMSRPPTPAELEQAADIIIPASELQRVYQAQAAERAREAKRTRRATATRNGTIFAQWLVIGAMAVSIASMLPLVRIEPVFVYTRDDGTVVSSRSFDQLPEAARRNATLNTLWRYVECREGYVPVAGEDCYRIASALSTAKVREDYQGWYSGPEGPPKRLGERGLIRIERISEEPIPDVPDAYRMTFRRIETGGPREIPPQVVSVILRHRGVDHPDRLRWEQRARFNAPAIEVYAYIQPNGGARQ